MSTRTMLVRKDKPAETRWLDTEDSPLADGQVRIHVDSYALTANNITYAAMGDAMQAGRFFPCEDAACVDVDIAGNDELRRQIPTRFAKLAHSCTIGATHVTALRGGKGLPGPTPTLYFAPAQIKKRCIDWAPRVLEQRLLEAWQAFTAKVSDPKNPWLLVQEHRGAEALQAGYAELLAGRSDPRVGHNFSLDA